MFCCIFFPSSRCFAVIPESHKFLTYLQLLSCSVNSHHQVDESCNCNFRISPLLFNRQLTSVPKQYISVPKVHFEPAFLTGVTWKAKSTSIYVTVTTLSWHHVSCTTPTISPANKLHQIGPFCYSSYENLALLYRPIYPVSHFT